MTFDDYPGIYQFIDYASQEKYKNHFIPDFIPLTGMSEKLREGNLNVLDVGCGTGFHSLMCGKLRFMNTVQLRIIW